MAQCFINIISSKGDLLTKYQIQVSASCPLVYFFVLFDLILYIPVSNFSAMSEWVRLCPDELNQY